jgi:hypothetical protein
MRALIVRFVVAVFPQKRAECVDEGREVDHHGIELRLECVEVHYVALLAQVEYREVEEDLGVDIWYLQSFCHQEGLKVRVDESLYDHFRVIADLEIAM